MKALIRIFYRESLEAAKLVGTVVLAGLLLASGLWLLGVSPDLFAEELAKQFNPVQEVEPAQERASSAVTTVAADEAELEPGMLGFRYEIIYETKNPQQIAKASKQFPNGWVWSLFKGGKRVAMPIASTKYPSSELVDWWFQHEPERYENYMTNGVYGSGGEYDRPTIEPMDNMEDKLEDTAAYLDRFATGLHKSVQREREKLDKLAQLEGRTMANLRDFGMGYLFDDGESRFELQAATIHSRELKQVGLVLYELRKEITRQHGLARRDLQEVEGEYRQVKAALDALGVTLSKADDVKVSRIDETVDDDPFGD